jgi:delta24-sterol reductase
VVGPGLNIVPSRPVPSSLQPRPSPEPLPPHTRAPRTSIRLLSCTYVMELLYHLWDLEYLVTHHRWFFVVFFLLPLSAAYDLYLMVRNSIVFFTRKLSRSQHDHQVKKICDELKQWVKEGSTQRLCTARPGWQAMSLRSGKYKKTYKNIDINLYNILEIDETNRLCRVEPMVTMGQLTHFLVPRGWTIPVLPELDDLTVGGLVAGVGIETSSHKYGLFQHICVAFEIILPDGR